jgi:hypothetical protein
MRCLTIIFVVGSVVLSISTASFADYVKYFYNEQNGNDHFINLKSVHSNKDGSKTAWCRRTFGDPRLYGGFSSVELKFQADCSNKKLQSVQMVAYNKEGKVLTTDSTVTELLLDRGTANYWAYKIMCGQKTPKQTLKFSVHK